MSGSQNASRPAHSIAVRSLYFMMNYSRLRTYALALFFLGGTSALVYEVTWVRLLSLGFGVSVYAVSAVLTAFMGGLALGSWLLGRRAAASATPGALLRLYALLQLGVGLCALLAPIAFGWLTSLYVFIARELAPGFYAFNLLRFGLAALVLLVPTTLMGGTLPVMSQLLARQEQRRGADLGALYAVNTFGAVIGACATGLLLIRWLGVQQTIYLAVALDWACAGIAFVLAAERRLAADRRPPIARKRREPKAKNRRESVVTNPSFVARDNTQQTTDNGRQTTDNRQRLVLVGFALSGFAALGYEVVWTRLLSIFSLNAVFSFTIMLTTFLVGLALGGALAARRVDRNNEPLRLFGYLELGIGLCAILVLYIFAKLPTLLERFTAPDTFGRLVFAEFFAAGVTMLVPTLLMGATFPAAARIYSAGSEAVGRRVGRLYALNTVGAALGAFVAGFGLIPLLGLQRAALALALLNLAVGVAALLSAARVPRLQLGGALAAAIVTAALLPEGVYLGFREGATSQLVYYREGADATVAVFHVQQPELKISFVNGRSEVPTDPQSMRAFYMLGHLPALLRPQAQSALMVSFGNGIATGALSTHRIPRIQAVELVAEQVEAARLYRQENRDVLEYPGLKIAIEDGRNYLLRSDERFDIITADATHPVNTSSWALFTREFYTLVRQRLADDGVFVQWLPFHDLSSQDFRDIIKTFQSVFPHTSLWYTGGPHTFLVATPRPLTRAEVLGLGAELENSAAGADLGDSRKLADDLLMEEDAVARYTAGARQVTDDSAFFIPAKDEEAILQSFAPYAQVGQGQP
jgi:spermidine synthase